MRQDDGFAVGSFRGASGGPSTGSPCRHRWGWICAGRSRRWPGATPRRGGARLRPDSVVFRRLFTSDLLNQADELAASPLAGSETRSGGRLLGAPAAADRASWRCWPTTSRTATTSPSAADPRHLLVEKRGRRHLWSTRLCIAPPSPRPPRRPRPRGVPGTRGRARRPGRAARRPLRAHLALHARRGCILPRHGEARRCLFAEHGLTRQTTTPPAPASRRLRSSVRLVAMDAYSALDWQQSR